MLSYCFRFLGAHRWGCALLPYVPPAFPFLAIYFMLVNNMRYLK